MKFYDDLGVERDATPDEIKAAHRRGVKANHPDRAGGDVKKFHAIQRAFDTLGDEEKRRRYDETGDADGASPMGEDAKIRELLYSLVEGMIEGDIDLEHFNAVKHISEKLAAVGSQIRANIARAEKKVARVDTMRKRLKKKARKGKVKSALSDMLFRSLDAKRAALSRPLQETREALERHLVITEIFEGFDYEVDPVEAEPRPWDRYNREDLERLALGNTGRARGPFGRF